MQVAAVILAAGTSSRFGSPKQLARIGGRTLLEAVVQIAQEARLAPVIVVVPPGLSVPPDVVPVLNDRPDQGLSRSLRLGIGAVPVGADAAVILLGDQPTTSVNSIRALVDADRGDHAIVAAEAEGRLGPPVLLMRRAFDAADAANGDEGLRRMLAESPERVMRVAVGSHPPDVDTPADLRALDARIAHMFDSSGDS